MAYTNVQKVNFAIPIFYAVPTFETQFLIKAYYYTCKTGFVGQPSSSNPTIEPDFHFVSKATELWGKCISKILANNNGNKVLLIFIRSLLYNHLLIIREANGWEYKISGPLRCLLIFSELLLSWSQYMKSWASDSKSGL